jgi:hypothetical protein
VIAPARATSVARARSKVLRRQTQRLPVRIHFEVGRQRSHFRALVSRSTKKVALLTSVILVGLIAVAPANVSSAAAVPRGDRLNAAAVSTIFKTLWPKFALAYATGDTAGIARYTDADVQKAIMGWFYCGCGARPTAHQQVNFTAPPQSGYPLSFLAEVQEKEYSTQPGVVEVVYTKQTSRSPWRIAYLVPYVNGMPLLYTSTINTPAPKTSVDVAGVGNQLAAFYQTVFDTGVAPTTWPQRGALQQETDRIVSSREFLSANHFTESLMYTAGPHSLDFAIPQGDLMCGEIRSHSVMSSGVAGTAIVQPLDQSLFGPPLPPGSYSSVTGDSLRDACWGVSPNGTTQPISFFGGVYNRVGVLTPAA